MVKKPIRYIGLLCYDYRTNFVMIKFHEELFDVKHGYQMGAYIYQSTFLLSFFSNAYFYELSDKNILHLFNWLLSDLQGQEYLIFRFFFNLI